MRNKSTAVRLNEWGHWVAMSRRLGGPRELRSWWGSMVTDPNVGAGIQPMRRLHEPVNEERAMATDAVIKVMPRRERVCIWQQYVSGGTKEQKAQRYGCKPATFYEHLEQAEAVFEEILTRQEITPKTPLQKRTRI